MGNPQLLATEFYIDTYNPLNGLNWCFGNADRCENVILICTATVHTIKINYSCVS